MAQVLKMKLSEKQIDRLYGFTSRHFVEWFDVQTELVDHLANGIETQWGSNPKLSFEEALKIEFKKFGVFGFSEIVEQRTKALNKYYRVLVWKEFKNYFKLPKIILTAFFIWLFYSLFNTIENKDFIIVPVFSLLVIYPFYHLIKSSRNIRYTKKITGKKWLFEHVISQSGGLIYLFQILIYLPIYDTDNSNWSLLFTLLVATAIVLFSLTLYVSIKIVAPNVREKLKKEHPDYLFVQRV